MWCRSHGNRKAGTEASGHAACTVGKQEWIESGRLFWNIKAHPQRFISLSKPPPPKGSKTPETTPLPGEHILKHMNAWGIFYNQAMFRGQQFIKLYTLS